MDAKYCKKKIEEISDKVSQIHFKMISHVKLITLSQYYIDFLFQFLGSEKANMGSFAKISSDMVYHPPIFDKFINYHHKYGKTNKTKEELRKCTTICYVNFYRVLDKKICYTYIEEYLHFISELSHMAQQLICYFKNITLDQIVSELFDGTMLINFGMRLDKICMDAETYYCLPEDIKKIGRTLADLDPDRPFWNSIHNYYANINALESTLPKRIKIIENCLFKNGEESRFIIGGERWKYIHNELVSCHMQSSYILRIYQEKYGKNDPYFINFWSTIQKADNQTYRHVGKILKKEFDICL